MSGSNVAASVRQRLLNRAREHGEDYQVLLTRYALERLLYRLSQSDRRDQFILKGAYAFLIWQGESHRPTRDLDLLGFGSANRDVLSDFFTSLCTINVADDGVVFDPETVTVRSTRERAVYDGVRVNIIAHIDTARLPLQVDVGFGDAVIPSPIETAFPSLLEFPSPSVRAYPRESVVAEKLHGIVLLGIANSRMKDYYDIWYLSQKFAFDGALLASAVAATFKRRGLSIPDGVPTGLSALFAEDKQKLQQWSAFLRNIAADDRALRLQDVLRDLRLFLQPPLRALREGTTWNRRWSVEYYEWC